MIIGSGFLAQNFKSYKDDESILIFASGVSNSKETNFAAFEREKELLKESIETHKNKKLIYFGTCSVSDPSEVNSLYVKHKLEMEKLISKSGCEYLAFRLPQLVGKNSNPHTLTNYIYSCINKNICFDLWGRSERNILDIDTVKCIVDYCINKNIYKNSAINIACPFNTRTIEIVRIFEKILGKSANYNLIDRGDSYGIDISNISHVMKILNMEFHDSYLESVLKKYYE
ncbi:NAD-dependent epimerase [Polynucleobacter sp. Ross1-W9]|uniref:hypothetical protein n=1 Tax=Polynucleobacter parvulilacunae TaxID=1855631 RepID=UPI001C0BF624|nr:hypothetical protein [Polynucleobacter parvulilacunae]MBU3556838.1 NAD-dependent epimerase [Polynucleobacter parvulilacunae]